MNFNNKIAVVTGGAQGIGRCIAEEFLCNGFGWPHHYTVANERRRRNHIR